jgi:hypothetical protein
MRKSNNDLECAGDAASCSAARGETTIAELAERDSTGESAENTNAFTDDDRAFFDGGETLSENLTRSVAWNATLRRTARRWLSLVVLLLILGVPAFVVQSRLFAQSKETLQVFHEAAIEAKHEIDNLREKSALNAAQAGAEAEFTRQVNSARVRERGEKERLSAEVADLKQVQERLEKQLGSSEKTRDRALIRAATERRRAKVKDRQLQQERDRRVQAEDENTRLRAAVHSSIPPASESEPLRSNQGGFSAEDTESLMGGGR